MSYTDPQNDNAPYGGYPYDSNNNGYGQSSYQEQSNYQQQQPQYGYQQQSQYGYQQQPQYGYQQGYGQPLAPGVSTKSRTVALILALVGFVGFAGLNRFYVGKIGTGILYLLTVGWFGFGTIYDLVLIIVGEFRDSQYNRLLTW